MKKDKHIKSNTYLFGRVVLISGYWILACLIHAEFIVDVRLCTEPMRLRVGVFCIYNVVFAL